MISPNVLFVGLFILGCYIYSNNTESYNNISYDSSTYLKKWLYLYGDYLYDTDTDTNTDNNNIKILSTKIEDLR